MPKQIEVERRLAERYGLKVKVLYEPSAAFMRREKRHAGKTINISRGGFCLKTETPLTQHQILRVHLPIPELKAVLPTLAEVCWVEGPKKEKSYSVGLRFLL